jgi:hypothetical protein
MVVATISLARTEGESLLLMRSLAALARHAESVFVTDGGSSPACVAALAALPRTRVMAASGLVRQVKSSVDAAVAAGASRLLYTEPDKCAFFETQLGGVLERCASAADDALIVVARSKQALATFPERQRHNESMFNRECAGALGTPGDFCYGPFVMPRQIAACVARCPDDLGWGWRPFVFALAHRLGCPLRMITGHFECPPEQRAESPADETHRDRQLAENRRGLQAGLDAPLAGRTR